MSQFVKPVMVGVPASRKTVLACLGLIRVATVFVRPNWHKGPVKAHLDQESG